MDLHHTWMRKVYTKEQRSELVELVLAGRATVAEAAARIGASVSTAFAWLRDARKPAARGPATFVQLVRAAEGDGGITVRVGGASVCVRRGFDADVLRAVVSALRPEEP